MRGFIYAASTLFLSLFTLGCPTTADYPRAGQACELDAEQKNAAWEPLYSLPITVRLDSKFSSSQRRAIENAIDTWNSFAQSSLRQKFFTLEKELLPEIDLSLFTVPQAFCGAYDSKGGLVMVSDSSKGHWMRMARRDSQLGLTGRCFIGSPMATASAAIVFNTWENSGDMFETVALHELGHVIGLDHSCRLDSGRYGHVGCSELPREHAYHDAVMAPEERTYSIEQHGHTTVLGERKESLTSNDMQRAYCLYTQFKSDSR